MTVDDAPTRTLVSTSAHGQCEWRSDMLVRSATRSISRACFAIVNLGIAVDFGDVGQEVEDAPRVSPLVVVPRDELHEMIVEGDTGPSIEEGAVIVTVKIAGHDLVFGVPKNACD